MFIRKILNLFAKNDVYSQNPCIYSQKIVVYSQTGKSSGIFPDEKRKNRKLPL
jgi:hypothetical protein